ncbi:MAG TPA: DUF4249 family protein [Longimicrobium sp.]|nr:DUF4249 family protein [Longimicrobium sp.]
MTPRTLALAALPLALAACTIADVTVPAGRDVLVVEAVLRTDQERQFVLLHRSIQDGAGGAERDAEVTVTDEFGQEFRFNQTGGGCVSINSAYLESDSLRIDGTCYMSVDFGGWVAPGVAYELEVRTTRGEVARGRTVVPGQFALAGMPYSTEQDPRTVPTCEVVPGTQLDVRWRRSEGAWGYVAPLLIHGLGSALGMPAPSPLELVGVSVSAADTTMVLPAEFGVFERFQYNQDLLRALQEGLPRGVFANLVVAAADRNYINGVRGGSFNPSGQARISSIAGDGIGVFGSLVPLRVDVVSQNPSSVPDC